MSSAPFTREADDDPPKPRVELLPPREVAEVPTTPSRNSDSV
jgi:hypothetical protein